MRAIRGKTILLRAAAAFVLLVIFPLTTAAQERDVRVILPLQLNARPTDEFERIEPEHRGKAGIGATCDAIAAAADANALPAPFLARLIWRESRFDSNAVARTGEQGIAQFPPGIAFKRDLRDAFDAEEAIPALAGYLAELRDRFGNIGLAAAAWEMGEERLAHWLENGGYLPVRTEDYLLAILGETPNTFRDAAATVAVKPLVEGKPFAEACRSIPDIGDAILLNDADRPAWGAQIAGHFDRATAEKQWQLLKQRHPALLGDLQPAIFSARSHLGRNRLYVVQIGADSRAEARAFCEKLRADDGACVVTRN